MPDFMASMPRDPAISEVPDTAQYLYKSDGKDYKLIAMYSGDCSKGVERDGARIDPRRVNSADGTCWSYGYWALGAEGY